MAGELPDYLRPGLDLVIVGFNPGLTSGHLGHYYAFKGNAFWRLLWESGILPAPLTWEEDFRVMEYGIGLTDVVKRMTGSSQDLSPQEMKEGAMELKDKLKSSRPGWVAFLGKGVHRAYFGKEPSGYGPTPQEVLPGIRGFVAPSPSGRVGIPYPEKLRYYRWLGECLGRPSGPGDPGEGRG